MTDYRTTNGSHHEHTGRIPDALTKRQPTDPQDEPRRIPNQRNEHGRIEVRPTTKRDSRCTRRQATIDHRRLTDGDSDHSPTTISGGTSSTQRNGFPTTTKPSAECNCDLQPCGFHEVHKPEKQPPPNTTHNGFPYCYTKNPMHPDRNIFQPHPETSLLFQIIP